MKQVTKTTIWLGLITLACMVVAGIVPTDSTAMYLFSLTAIGFNIATFVFGIKCVRQKVYGFGWTITVLTGLMNLVYLMSFLAGVLIGIGEIA